MSRADYQDLQETMDKIPGRAKGLEPFQSLLSSDWRQKELAQGDKKLVGQMCNFAPEELITAAGAIPVRLDTGFPPAAGPDSMPQDTCCAVRSLAYSPAQHPGGLPEMDLTIVPTACDGKRKLARILAQDRQVFTLELPFSKRAEDSTALWRKRMDSLLSVLQKLTGHKVSRTDLRRAVALHNRQRELARELNKLRADPLPRISGPDALMVMQASFMADINWWNEKVEALLAELQAGSPGPEAQPPRARLLLTGSPILWPEMKLPLAILATGADVVADELCSGSQRLHHPTVVDEDTRGGLIRAVGERTLLPSTCPCFAEQQDRLERLGSLIEEYRIDGVVQHTLRVCQNYDVDAISLGRYLAHKEIPFLQLYTEFSDESAAGLNNRVEAFVEMISQRPSDSPAGSCA